MLNVVLFCSLLKSKASQTTVHKNDNKMAVGVTAGAGVVTEAPYHRRNVREL